MSATDVSAVGTVVTRHTCDGRLTREDYEDQRLVFKDRHGRYYIRVLAYKQPVTRIENTSRFLLHFAGVSPAAREEARRGQA